MPPTIYFDTNVVRYFAISFRDAPVDAALKQHFAMSPISLLELLSELATPDADAAFRTIQAFPNIFDTDHLALLPWEDDVFRTLVFGQPQPPNPLVELLGNATRRGLSCEFPGRPRCRRRQLRDLMDQTTRITTDDFARLLDSWRAHNGITR